MSQDPLHLLCVEPKFPGRLGGVADWLVRRRGYRCQFYCASVEAKDRWPSSVGRGLDVVAYPVGGVAREAGVHWTRDLERGLCYAFGCWETLEARRPRPIDVVLGRSADLGSTLFVPPFAPGVPRVNYFDYFYHPRAFDLADEAGPETPAAYYHWRRAHNAMALLDLENGVTPWAPTHWQRGLFPGEYRDDFFVLFDGVETRRQGVATGRRARSIGGRTIDESTRVVTFVARSLDRLRGFDRFVGLTNRLARARPDVVFVAVGQPIVHRGLDVEYYNRDFSAEVLRRDPPHDPDRFRILGPVPPSTVAEVLAASDLHVYPGRAYAVASSLVEAMAAGCVVLAWDEAPVREFLDHGRTALLARPGDPDEAERLARAVLDDPAGHRPLGDAAATLARERFGRDATLPALAERLARLADEVR